MRQVLPRNHRSLRDARMPTQRRLDLAGLDPVPAQLHLRIRAPQELELPRRTPPRHVPGPVHPAPGRTIRVRNKPLRRQTRTTRVAARNASPANVELTRHSDRNELQLAIEDVGSVVRHRTAD